MNKNQIKKILEDLYAVDGNLRQYEKELEKIILKILEYKPQAEFDENFRLELRTRLMAEAERLKQTQPIYGGLSSVWRLFKGRFAYAGVLGVILILMAATWFANKPGVLNLSSRPKPQALTFQKTALKNNAFGSLFIQEAQPITAQDSSSQSQSSAAPEKMDLGVGGGGGAPYRREQSGGGGVAVSGRGGFSEPGIPYYIPEYKFVYKGGDFDLPGDSVEVLRRKTGFDGLGGLENMLNTLGMGLIDLFSFDPLKLQNINLVDERDLGYSINIDFQSATISISQNNWPYVYTEPLVRSTEPLKPSDIPSDEKLIEIANNFLREHGISTQNYGQPEVDNNFRVGIMEPTKASAPNQSSAQGSTDIALYPYIQESVQVIYPLLINSQTVYDEGGNKNGMYVNVNIYAMRATGLWNLTSQNYEASMYEAQTDKAKIIEAAENGGVYGARYFSEGVKIVEVELGTPQFGYSNIWNYQNGQSNQLLVPALIFPVTKIPSEVQYFYQKNIVIPLAKEFFDRKDNIPVPLPMPLEAKPNAR